MLHISIFREQEGGIIFIYIYIYICSSGFMGNGAF